MHYILVVLSLFLRNRGLWRPASVFSMWCDIVTIYGPNCVVHCSKWLHLQQRWTWVGSIHELDWVGLGRFFRIFRGLGGLGPRNLWWVGPQHCDAFLPRAKLCSANICCISAVSVTACESVVSLFPYYHTKDVSEAEVYIPAEVLKRLFKLTCVRSYIFVR